MIRTVAPSTLFLLAAACAVSAEAPNLARNPSFEEADAKGLPAGWAPEPAGMTTVSFGRDVGQARTGTASARITTAPAQALSWPAFALRLPVHAGECYQVEAHIRTRDVVNCAYLATDFLDAGGARLSFAASPLVTGTTDWTHVGLKAQIPTGAVAMALRLILYGTGTAWFDDVVITRDLASERLMAKLQEPLPAEMLARGITSEGNLRTLHRLLQTARKGGKLVVGVIGGSITQGASASGPDKHYSAYVVRWLKEHFPNTQVSLVNAGIGATGSDYGCMRAQRDLLSKGPDLVVVEYGVNDGNDRQCAETYEGLVRQVLASPRRPATMLLFMMTDSGANAQEWQSKVGRHYGLPMLSYRDLLWPEIQAGRLRWSAISPDTVHPNDLGHGYTGKLLTALLDRALATLPQRPVGPVAQRLPAPLLTDAYQYTALFEADDLKPVSNRGWSYDPAGGWDRCLKSATPGSVLELDVEGEHIHLSYWRVHGPMGIARIQVDGGEPTIQDGWFDQTWGGYRQMVRLASLKPGVHRVRIELLADRHPQSAGNEFRVLCLAAAGVRK